jgi:hypothetical protein
MTDLRTTRRPTIQTVGTSPARQAERPVLVTEQQVRFSTAAAVPLPGVKIRRWARAMGAVRGFFAAPNEPMHHHHPKRYAFLEDALMAREMGRL